MKMSAEASKVFAAFVKFQSELDMVGKTKEGHGYKYADLGACIEVSKPHLIANDLAIAQPLGSDESGNQTLTTVVVHSSGEWFSDTCILPKAVLNGNSGKNPVQCLGSSITYMRRYCYASTVGLAQVDDDAINLVSPKNQPINPAIDLIVEASKSGDSEFITREWTISIAANWNILDSETIVRLNNIMNGGIK